MSKNKTKYEEMEREKVFKWKNAKNYYQKRREDIITNIIRWIIFTAVVFIIIYAVFQEGNILLGVFLTILLGWFPIIGILDGIGFLIGKLQEKKFIYKQNKNIKKTNPYIYYRELPNNYGIGVNTLLTDSDIENEKDIIAVILDLCAKKYLFLSKENNRYFIKVLKKPDDQLLKNERYILELIVSKEIKSINYNEWYNCCLKDGESLNLYYHDENIYYGRKYVDDVINYEYGGDLKEYYCTNGLNGVEDKYKRPAKIERLENVFAKIKLFICLFISLFLFLIALIVEGWSTSVIAIPIGVFVILYFLISVIMRRNNTNTRSKRGYLC